MPATDIITPCYIRRAVLPSVRFIDRTGAPIADDFFYRAIDTAISDVETRTGLALLVDYRKLVEERPDALEWHDATWFLKKTLKRPIQSVSKFGFVYGNYPVDYMPSDWLRPTSFKMGQIQIVPGPTGINLQTYHYWFPYPWDGAGHYMAGIIKIEYYAGYDKLLTGTHAVAVGQTAVTITGATNEALGLEPGTWVKLGANVMRVMRVVDGNNYLTSNPAEVAYSGTAIHLQYPGAVLGAISALAGVAMLDLAGSLLYGAGVTSKALAMDGLAQSKGINPKGPYGEWKKELLATADRLIAGLWAEHTPVRVFAI